MRTHPIRGRRWSAALAVMLILPVTVAEQAVPAHAVAALDGPRVQPSYGYAGAPPIGVGNNPHGVAVDPVTGTVFVANMNDGTVSVISEATGQVTATIPVGTDPSGVAVDASTGTVFVANYISATVSVISEAASPANDAVVATLTTFSAPYSVAADSAHGTVWVNENGVAQPITEAASPANDTIGAAITLPGGSAPVTNGPDPDTVAVDPATQTVYVLDGDGMSVISEVSDSVVSTVSLGSNDWPEAVAADPRTGTVYVADVHTGVVSVISEAPNPVNDTVTGTIQIPFQGGSAPAPLAMAVDPASGTVYVSSYVGSLTVISEASQAITTTIDVDGATWGYADLDGIAFSPATGDVYVASDRSNELYVVLPQSIGFAAPSCPSPGCEVGQTSTLAATGGTSGNPVTFSVDPSSGTGVCSVSGSNGTTLNYLAAGTCVVDANQAGSNFYLAAPQVSVSITVLPAKKQTIKWTPPSTSYWGMDTGYYGTTVTLKAIASSGLPVTFTIDPSTQPGVCTVSGTDGTTLSYTALGTCVIDANQAGNSTYLPAPQVQASISVDAATQTITFKPPATETIGKTATLTATGGGSGNTVVFTLDPSTNPAVCNLSGPGGSTVSFTAVGTCVIDANQAGSQSAPYDYMPAVPVQGAITVGIAPTFVQASPPLSVAPGSPYNYTFVASGIPAPTYSLSAGAPSWLSINATTGQVSGTVPNTSPEVPYTYSVTATNKYGTATTSRFVVLPAPSSPQATAQVTSNISCGGNSSSSCTLTITNNGAAAAQVIASVVLPPQSYVSQQSPCPDSYGCFQEANTLTWSAGWIAANGSASFSFNLVIAASCTGSGCPPLEAVADTPSQDNLGSGDSSTYLAASELVPADARLR